MVYVLGPLTPRSPLPEAGRGEAKLRAASCEWFPREYASCELVVAEKPITEFRVGNTGLAAVSGACELRVASCSAWRLVKGLVNLRELAAEDEFASDGREERGLRTPGDS